ncbi:hypothetical protein GW17_00061929 [Ensete ventricosum]|nr:hypothetical protein GW17_00061929 [Ensete ventricosum]
MRLYRVESFYAFLLHFRSEGSKEEGRPATASPHVGPATRGQGPLQGGGRLCPGPARKGGQRRSQGEAATRKVSSPQKRRPRGQQTPTSTVDYGQPTRVAAARGHNRLQCDAHKGGQLHGAGKGLSPATSPTASSGGNASRRCGRPLAGQLPAGKGSHHLSRGSGGCGGAEVERGVRASFGEKDDPAPMNLENFEDYPCVYDSHNTLNNSKNSLDCPLI